MRKAIKNKTIDSSIKTHKVFAALYTQEMLSVGEIRDPLHSLTHVPMAELIRNGLFALLPQARAPGLYQRVSLHYHTVALKRIWHGENEGIRINQKDLELSDRLAGLFKGANATKAPFVVFATFLAAGKRTLRMDCTDNG